MRLLLFVLSFFFLVLQASAQVVGTDVYSALANQYRASVAEARSTLNDPARPTGYERFILVFSLYRYDRDQRIGRILVAAKEQEKIAARYISKQQTEVTYEPPSKNAVIVDAALTSLKTRLKMLCQYCVTAQDWSKHRKVVDAYFEVFDITDAHSGFSGLPFTKLMQTRFFEARFQQQVTKLYQGLTTLLESSANHPELPVESTLWDEALKATDGDKGAAVELLGLLSSRDVLITRYMKFMNVSNPEFVRAFTMTPVATRLLVELDRKARNDVRDRFSYDGKYMPADDRTYYFWSAALAAKKLKEAGHSEKEINTVALEFSRQYKNIRFFEQRGFLKSKEWYQGFQANSIKAFLTTAKGARIGLQSLPEELDMPKEESEAYLRSLQTNGTIEEQLKKDWIKKALEQGLPPGKAAILFYDFGDSKAGFSHLKLAIGTEVFEIHRFLGNDNTYLRERTLLESLADSRPGALPSGILEMEMTAETQEKVLTHLRTLGDASMQYSFFNKLVNEEAFNCAGIIYESLKLAGIPLPALNRTDAFSHQIFHKLVQSVPNARSLGKTGKWIESIVRPNVEVASFTGARQKSNADFKASVGKEWLKAEQALSASTPKLSNLRNLLGDFIPSYSATGNLAEKYTPSAAQTLKLKTFLLPLEKAGEVLTVQEGFEELQDHAFVELEGKKYVRIFVHPNEAERFAELEKTGIPDPIEWIATPSSSARSLFVQDAKKQWPVFGVKASLSVRMGGADRIIDQEKTARAIEISKIIAGIHKKTQGNLPQSGKSWQFMAEPISVLPNEKLGGFIFRALPPNSNQRILLPVFSLVSAREGQQRWIEELYRYSGRASKLEFVTKDIIAPLVELHNILSLQNGLTTELHQQNALFEVDPKTKRIVGVVVRDMDSHWIDHSLRAHRLGLANESTADFKSEAYAYRYGLAQENQIKSYSEILRTRSLEWILKYFLSEKDLKEALNAADQQYMNEFNRQFPEVQVESLGEMENAWEKLHAKVTPPEEAQVYKQINASNAEQKKNWILEIVRWIQKKLTSHKLKASKAVVSPANGWSPQRCDQLFGI